MSIAISSISLNDLQPSTGTGTQSATPGAGVPKQTPAPISQTDTVKLSVTQQVRNLHSEGEGPGQIASSLGLTSTQVSNDLYVSLTWPQLLSKVASSSLNFGSTSSDASPAVAATPAAGPAAPAAGAATPAAVLFPRSKGDSAVPAAATLEPKSTSALNAVLFPGARDASAAAADGAKRSATAA